MTGYDDQNIIVREDTGSFRVKARTEIAAFNQAFGTTFPDDNFDTIGGERSSTAGVDIHANDAPAALQQIARDRTSHNSKADNAYRLVHRVPPVSAPTMTE